MAVSRIETAFNAVRIRTVILVVMDRSDAEIEQRLCRIGKKAAAKRRATTHSIAVPALCHEGKELTLTSPLANFIAIVRGEEFRKLAVVQP